MESRTELSHRARRFWQRLQEFYGARLAESYGPKCPKSWAHVVDAASDSDVQRTLTAVRSQHPSHPPSLGEVEKLLRPANTNTGNRSPAEQLTTLVHRHHWPQLSPRQRNSRWMYVAEQQPGTAPDGRPRPELTITAVIVPADPLEPDNYPELRIELPA